MRVWTTHTRRHNHHTFCPHALLQPSHDIPQFLSGRDTPATASFSPRDGCVLKLGPCPDWLGPLHLVCWETNGDLDGALGEHMRMWFLALALDHRSHCALWSQILSVCVGREYVVLWTGQTLSGDQLTQEFISSETRSDSPHSSFFNCPYWQELRANRCIRMSKYVDAAYDKWNVNHRKWDHRGR